MRTALVILVAAYRAAVSPLFGPSCRFHPTCSTYALRALRRFGPLRGSWLAVRRIARCHPWHPGGHDPVPLRAAPASAPAPRRSPPPPAGAPE